MMLPLNIARVSFACIHEISTDESASRPVIVILSWTETFTRTLDEATVAP